MTRAINKYVSLLLIVLLAIPIPVSAKPVPKTTVALVAYPSGDEGVDAVNQEFVRALGLKMGNDVMVIDPKIVCQVIKTRPGQYQRSQQEEVIYKNLNNARQSFLISNNAAPSLDLLKDVEKQILTQPNYSTALSDLMETTLLMRALIYFKSAQTDLATGEIARLVMLKGSKPVVTGYPDTFKKFIGKMPDAGPGFVTKVNSSPEGVQVFVDGIYRGVTPTAVSLAKGKYKVALASNGRKTIIKTVTVSENGAVVKENLPWTGSTPYTSKQTSPGVVDGLSVADTLSSFALAQKTVVHTLFRDSAGYHSSLQVIDGKFHQPLKKVEYKNKITDFKKSAPNMVSYYLARIDTQVERPANELYQSDYDKGAYSSLRLSDRPNKPITKSPVFWSVVGGLVITGIVLGLTQTGGGGHTVPATGSISIDMGGF